MYEIRERREMENGDILNMKKGNFSTAIITLEQAIDDIKRDHLINRVFIRLMSNNGGITNINAVVVKSGICSADKIFNYTDEQDSSKINFMKILQGIQTGKHTGSVVFEVLSNRGVIYKSRVTHTEYTDQESCDRLCDRFCGEFGAQW